MDPQNTVSQSLMPRLRELNWKFLRWWLIANLLGVFLGVALGLVIGIIASQVLDGLAEDRVPMLEIMGVVLAALQGAVMHKQLGHGKAWLVVTSIAWLLGIGLVRAISGQINWPDQNAEVWAASLHLLLGIWIGTAQWLLVRTRLTQAGWWLMASAVGWLSVGVLNGKSINRPLDFLILGGLPALCTGASLMWLTRPKIIAAVAP